MGRCRFGNRFGEGPNFAIDVRYPLGIQDFRRLRTDGYAYVDKTRQIVGMLNAGAALLLSRPRRFGKSLTVSTLAELYGGASARSLFAGLWAGEHWDFARMERPVIWLKFDDFDSSGSLEPALARELRYVARRLGHTLGDATESPSALLRELIDLAAGSHPSGRCVVLFDEYDKPIVDYLDDAVRAERNRVLLKRSYGLLKGMGDRLELLFLTGVSAFSKVSIFSDLNHVVNLTLDPRASDVVGITVRELERQFSAELDATGVPRETVRRWYNGYSWGGPSDERVYNPWSLFNFLGTGEVTNYWFQTGTPTWLVRLMRDRSQYDPTGIEATRVDLTGFTVDAIDTTTALFQTGYLTVANVRPGLDSVYTLDYPNVEVRQSLETMLLASYLEVHDRETRTPVHVIAGAFRQSDLPTVFAELNALLASVPYGMWQRGDEGIFHAVVHLTFSLIGSASVPKCTRVTVGVTRWSKRRRTCTCWSSSAIVRSRRRWHRSARGYLEAYAASAETRVAVGVTFGSEARAIVDWGVEEVSCA